MHKLPIFLSLFFTLLLNTTTSYTMITVPSTKKKPQVSQQYTSLQFILFAERLNTKKLLLENEPFDFLKLLPELYLYVASFTTPQSIGNLSATCHELNQKISFQTPYVWNIVCHSLNAMSPKKMPELLLKAHLCINAETNEQKKLFYTDIKSKILACYDPSISRPYKYKDCFYCSIAFDVFSPSANPLLGACYTGDKRIIIDMLSANNTISNKEINHLFFVTIDREQTNILPMLCATYTTYLESKFVAHLETATIFDWDNFIAGVALLNDKKKSFETLIIYYKKYLNLIDQNKRTYLDYVDHKNEILSKDCQDYINIIKHHGGVATKQKPVLLKSDVITEQERNLLKDCTIQ